MPGLYEPTCSALIAARTGDRALLLVSDRLARRSAVSSGRHPATDSVGPRLVRSSFTICSRGGVAVTGWAAVPIETERRGVVA
jgi:hypothetical protein